MRIVERDSVAGMGARKDCAEEDWDGDERLAMVLAEEREKWVKCRALRVGETAETRARNAERESLRKEIDREKGVGSRMVAEEVPETETRVTFGRERTIC